jgi:hypothetical protein
MAACAGVGERTSRADSRITRRLTARGRRSDPRGGDGGDPRPGNRRDLRAVRPRAHTPRHDRASGRTPPPSCGHSDAPSQQRSCVRRRDRRAGGVDGRRVGNRRGRRAGPQCGRTRVRARVDGSLRESRGSFADHTPRSGVPQETARAIAAWCRYLRTGGTRAARVRSSRVTRRAKRVLSRAHKVTSVLWLSGPADDNGVATAEVFWCYVCRV